MSEQTIKGKVNRKWTSGKNYRKNYDEIFGKKDQNLQTSDSCTDEQSKVLKQVMKMFEITDGDDEENEGMPDMVNP